MAERSWNDIQSLIRAALPDPGKDSYLWIRDVYTSKVVYDVDNKSYERTYVIDDAGAVTLGDAMEVTATTVYQPVRMPAYSLGRAAFNAEYDEWSGKIFEATTFPERDIAFSESDLDVMVASFIPCDLDIEHLPAMGVETLLDGKLGKLVKIWRQGKDLFGLAHVPRWLSDVIPEAARRVSVFLNPETLKQVVGLALVINPRVEDAALVSAYAAFAGRRHSAADVADMQKMHDLAVKQGAACTKSSAMSAGSNTPASSGLGGKPKMNLWEKLVAFAKGDKPEDFDPAKVTYDGEPVKPEDAKVDPPIKLEQVADPASKAELETLKAQNAAFAVSAFTANATTYVDALIASHRLTPGEKDKTVEAIVKAQGTAAFSADGVLVESETVKALKEVFEARPAHVFTNTLTAAGTLTAIGTGGGETMSPERRTQLLAGTPEGRAALADEKKEAK